MNNGRGAFPWLSASFSAPRTPPFYAIDGNRWYHAAPANRWTAEGSPNERDTLTLDFGAPRAVDELRLYFVDDGEGAAVRAPAGYAVETWTRGAWRAVASQRRTPRDPEGRRANVVAFPRLTTSKLRVVLVHRAGARSGLTELEAWSRAPLDTTPPRATSSDLALGARASASFTGRSDGVEQVNDGVIAFTRYSRNRWTAYGTPNASDWIQLDLDSTRTVRTVELYLWGDDRGVKAPKRYTVEYWTGRDWSEAAVVSRRPEQPLASAVNTVIIRPVRTTKLRVVFEHDRPAASGVTEVEVY